MRIWVGSDLAALVGVVWGVVAAFVLVVGCAVNETRLVVGRLRNRTTD